MKGIIIPIYIRKINKLPGAHKLIMRVKQESSEMAKHTSRFIREDFQAKGQQNAPIHSSHG